jgi:hypothetical protein
MDHGAPHWRLYNVRLQAQHSMGMQGSYLLNGLRAVKPLRQVVVYRLQLCSQVLF